MHTTNKEIRKRIFSSRGFSRFVVFGFLLFFLKHSFAQQPIPVNLPDSATGNPNSSVSIPITIGDVTGRNVAGYTAFVQYDNSVLRATGISSINTLSEVFPTLNINFFDLEPPVSGISVQALGAPAPLSGSGVLLNLEFDVIGNPSDSTNLGLSFAFNLGSPPAQIFPGKFTINSPDIEVSPLSLDFGLTFPDSAVERAVQVANSGTYKLTINNMFISGENAGSFSLVSFTPPVIIATGGTSQIPIRFFPGSIGIKNAILNIDSDDPDEPRVTVDLLGFAAPKPEISIAVDSLNFAAILIDSTATRALTIRNVGSGDLVISELNLSGPHSNEFGVEGLVLPFVIQRQDSQSVEVSFSPDSAGIKNAFLEIVSNDKKTPSLSIPLNGVGKEEANISLDISSIRFEDVFSDSTKSALFTIKNSGSANLEIFSIETTGRNPEDFLIGNVSPPFTVLPADSQQVEVVFSPTATGERSAFIEIRTNDPNNALLSIPVSGASLPALLPEIYVSSDTLTFGTLEVEADSTIELYIGNSGEGNLLIDNITIKDQAIADFRFAAPEQPFEIAPGDSQKVEVTFSPNRDGFKTAILEISGNAPYEPVKEVILQGNGVLSFIFLSNIVTPNNSVICGDSATIEVEFFVAGGVAPVEIVCKINGEEFFASGQKLAVTIPVLSDSFLVEVECLAKDALGRTRSGQDSIFVLKAKPLVFKTKIISPQNGDITILNSINVLVEHQGAGGKSPISSECRINGIPAIEQDGLFFAKIPLAIGENLIIATCLAQDDCGFKVVASDSVLVTRIAEPSCQVEIISPDNDQVVCEDNVRIEARVKIPDFLGVVKVTTMIGEEVVPLSEDSLFSADISLQSGRNLIVAKAIVEFENGQTIECVDSVYVNFDDVVPKSDFWPDAGKIVGVLTDSLSGLATIEVLQIINARLVIDEFQPGAKQIQFQVIPKDPSQSLLFLMKVTDLCGNSVITDPVYVNLSIENSGNLHKIDFFSIDKFLTVKNNGVEMIRCKLNQKEFVLFTEQIAGRPKPNSYQIAKYGETTFDLSSELRPGDNLLEVQLIGQIGASVEFFLADQAGAIDYFLEINSAPQAFTLRPNYPNPFNPSTNIEFEVPVKYARGVRVKVQIYNILGEVVRDLINEYKQTGVYTIVWDGTNNQGSKLSSGIYILNMQAESFSMQRRMLLLR